MYSSKQVIFASVDGGSDSYENTVYKKRVRVFKNFQFIINVPFALPQYASISRASNCLTNSNINKQHYKMIKSSTRSRLNSV